MYYMYYFCFLACTIHTSTHSGDFMQSNVKDNTIMKDDEILGFTPQLPMHYVCTAAEKYDPYFSTDIFLKEEEYNRLKNSSSQAIKTRLATVNAKTNSGIAKKTNRGKKPPKIRTIAQRLEDLHALCTKEPERDPENLNIVQLSRIRILTYSWWTVMEEDTKNKTIEITLKPNLTYFNASSPLYMVLSTHLEGYKQYKASLAAGPWGTIDLTE